jgi:hypothetical protein
MKSILILILSLNIFAGVLITTDKEEKAIFDLIGSLKQSAWERGHDNIEVESEKFDTLRFNKFLNMEMHHMEETLMDEDIISFNQCLILDTCELYKINVSSEFYAGFGFDYHFVIYDSLSGDIQVQTFTGYNE